jgi:hypothetical protein
VALKDRVNRRVRQADLAGDQPWTPTGPLTGLTDTLLEFGGRAAR